MGGFFGLVSRNRCVNDLFYGTDYHSHLGTKRGGMVTLDKNVFVRSIHNIENAYFRNKFESELNKYPGNSGIGIISDTDPQPIVLNTHLGRFAIVTVAKICNINEIEEELLKKGNSFSELSSGKTNPTETIALLITQKDDFVSGIEYMFSKIQGSCSLLLLTENGIIAARDKMGRTPIILGRRDDAYAVASESSSLPNIGFEIERFLGPGEIINIEADKVTVLRKPNDKMQICSFLWVYYGFPTSDYEGKNVDAVRYGFGNRIAKRDSIEADSVSGIPDSGIGCAVGYSEGTGIPFKRAIQKYTPTWPRSFTPESQDMRNLVAKMKLIPNRALLNGKKVVFCDDSIVRGTQLRNHVEILFGYGAKEVHMRISCPPLIYACPFVNFSASKSALDLIARRVIKDLEGDPDKKLEVYATTGSPEQTKMIDVIRKSFGMNTLKFSSLEDMVDAIGINKEHICTHCFDGSSCF